MNLEIDHIVHFINRNPIEPVKEWKEKGYHAVLGGRHEKWGTYNSLIYFGLSYIEYLAIENLSIAEKSDNPLIKQTVKELPNGEGIGQICFRTSNISELKDSLRVKGYKTSDIYEGSRKRDDGSLIEWKMLFMLEDSSIPFPFFIEWKQGNEERLHDLKQRGIISDNLENVYIKSIYYSARNVEKTAKEWSTFFDCPIYLETIDGRKAAILKVGTFKIIFVESVKVDNSLERPYMVEFQPILFENNVGFFGSVYK